MSSFDFTPVIPKVLEGWRDRSEGEVVQTGLESSGQKGSFSLFMDLEQVEKERPAIQQGSTALSWPVLQEAAMLEILPCMANPLLLTGRRGKRSSRRRRHRLQRYHHRHIHGRRHQDGA